MTKSLVLDPVSVLKLTELTDGGTALSMVMVLLLACDRLPAVSKA